MNQGSSSRIGRTGSGDAVSNRLLQIVTLELDGGFGRGVGQHVTAVLLFELAADFRGAGGARRRLVEIERRAGEDLGDQQAAGVVHFGLSSNGKDLQFARAGSNHSNCGGLHSRNDAQGVHLDCETAGGVNLARALLQHGMIIEDLSSRLCREIETDAILEAQLRRVVGRFDYGAVEHRTGSAHVGAVHTNRADSRQNPNRGGGGTQSDCAANQ